MSSETMKANQAMLRQQMKEMLSRCTPAQQDVFRLMYDHQGVCESPVDNIPPERMDWAFQQLERTFVINGRAEEEKL